MHRHLVLAACGLIGAGSACAAELPARKTGLWDMKLTFEGRNVPPQTMQHCVDANTDKAMNANFGVTTGTCSKKDIQVSGATITIDSVCQFGTGTSTSHAVITGNFDQAYTVKVTSTRQGGRPTTGAPGQETHLTLEAKWLGPCKPGQKPGDIVMSNGMTINVLDTPTPGAPPQR